MCEQENDVCLHRLVNPDVVYQVRPTGIILDQASTVSYEEWTIFKQQPQQTGRSRPNSYLSLRHLG